jgi:predicted alpha/beta-hydrolase family hydrolase
MSSIEKRTVKITVDEKATVSAVIAAPKGLEGRKRECVVWAHGAGADMHHPFISYFHQAIAAAGWVSVKFNFLYKEQGRKAPDPTAKLENTFVRVLDFVRDSEELKPSRIFMGGKSMGGRIASQLVAKGQAADGLVFLGYPLHAPNRHDRLRSEHLTQITCPMLFVEGTNDPFCDLDLLTQVRAQIRTPTEIYLIEGGNHDFRVPKRLGRPQEAILKEIAAVICQTLRRWSPTSSVSHSP